MGGSNRKFSNVSSTVSESTESCNWSIVHTQVWSTLQLFIMQCRLQTHCTVRIRRHPETWPNTFPFASWVQPVALLLALMTRSSCNSEYNIYLLTNILETGENLSIVTIQILTGERDIWVTDVIWDSKNTQWSVRCMNAGCCQRRWYCFFYVEIQDKGHEVSLTASTTTLKP